MPGQLKEAHTDKTGGRVRLGVNEKTGSSLVATNLYQPGDHDSGKPGFLPGRIDGNHADNFALQASGCRQMPGRVFHKNRCIRFPLESESMGLEKFPELLLLSLGKGPD
jgi:hypothetical protein